MTSFNLNRKLTLQSPVAVPDGAGGYSNEWTPFGTLWAEIRPGRGNEFVLATLDVARVPLTIIVRGAPVGDDRRPRSDQRFVEGNRVYRILAVREIGADARYLSCVAEEEHLS